MRGRSSLLLLSSSVSVVVRLMQEQRSNEAKKAEATLVPTQLAILSSLSHDINPHALLLLLLLDIVEG